MYLLIEIVNYSSTINKISTQFCIYVSFCIVLYVLITMFNLNVYRIVINNVTSIYKMIKECYYYF